MASITFNFADKHTYDFEGKVWPTAAKQHIGLIAMKVFGGENGKSLSNSLMPLTYHAQAFRYALSQPHVSMACIGMATGEELQRNVAWAKSFQPMKEAEIEMLADTGRELASKWKHHYWGGSINVPRGPETTTFLSATIASAPYFRLY